MSERQREKDSGKKTVGKRQYEKRQRKERERELKKKREREKEREIKRNGGTHNYLALYLGDF